MPKALSSDVRRAQEVQKERDIERAQKERKYAEIAAMRDITKSVESSPAIPGDNTHNGDNRRKPRSSDSIERHKPNRAYVLSDTTVYDGDRIIAVRRSSSKLIVRNADGTPNAADTLALAAAWNNHRASKGRR